MVTDEVRPGGPTAGVRWILDGGVGGFCKSVGLLSFCGCDLHVEPAWRNANSRVG